MNVGSLSKFDALSVSKRRRDCLKSTVAKLIILGRCQIVVVRVFSLANQYCWIGDSWIHHIVICNLVREIIVAHNRRGGDITLRVIVAKGNVPLFDRRE